MTDTPPEDENPDAEAAFERTLRNLVNTPPTPHKIKDGEDEREPKVSGGGD